MKAIVKVGKVGLMIPIEKLKGIKEGDLLEIEIRKVYADNDVKKTIKFAIAE